MKLWPYQKPTKWLLPQYYDVPQVLESIRYLLVREIGRYRFVRSSFWNGVLGVLYSSRDWISVNVHQMIPPTILWCSPSIGLNPISIGPRNWKIQVRSEIEWLVFWIVLEIELHSKLAKWLLLPNYELNPISIGPWNWTIQVRTKFVLKWSG